MKIFDDEKDLFLHDFGKAGDEVTDEAGGAAQARTGQEFAFGPQAAGAEKPRRRRGLRVLGWFVGVTVLLVVTAFYIRYYVPHTEESRTRGYVTLVEKRGIVFKTFEGEMISDSRLTDTAKVYARDVRFSIPGDSLGRVVQEFQATGRPVVITTKKYYGTLPWRGATNTILTDIQPQ